MYTCSSSKAVVGHSDSDEEGNPEGEGVKEKEARKEPLSLDELIAKKAEAEARESKVIPACAVYCTAS